MHGDRPDVGRPGPDYYLINSISRSGGTYLRSLFAGRPGVLAFPIEFPTSKGGQVDFVTQARFESLSTVKEWLDETNLPYHIERFASHPYGRSFGRERNLGEPDLAFDYADFVSRLSEAFPTLGTVGNAYQQTWRLFFASTNVDGRPFAQDTRTTTYVNHYATNATRDFAALDENAALACRLYLIHLVRDPLENVASLVRHWRNISNRRGFVRLAMARWELHLYSALRNKLRYPERSEVFVYDSDVNVMREQFVRSRLSLPRHTAQMDLHPTVLGIPLSGQSYKEKSGRSVAEPYEYEKLFPLDDLAFLKSRVREIYHSLGVQELRDLANEYVPTKELRSLLDTDSGTFELMSSRFCDVVDFAHQSHVDYRRNLFNTYREQGYRRGLAELARLLLKVLKLR